MSEVVNQEVFPPNEVSFSKKYPKHPIVPIVRVVENNVRSLPLQKQTIADIKEAEVEDDDLLQDAFNTMITEASEQYLAKQIEELNAREASDVEPQIPDPEVEELIEAVIDDEGEYVQEPVLNEEISYTKDVDPVAAFESSERYIAKANEENMKDEPYTQGPSTFTGDFNFDKRKPNNPIADREVGKAVIGAVREAHKQAEHKGTLQFLKSVEGRVLTVLEAAFSNTEQREAVKSLIKKEFRREMNRVNHLNDEE